MTVTPTGLRTYEPANVVPPFADVICDCRALPGQSFDDIADTSTRRSATGFDYELELLEPLAGGTESPTDTPLFEALARVRRRARATPSCCRCSPPGSPTRTGSARRSGTVAYGFAPVLFGDLDAYLSAAHAADEAIEIADLVEMAEFHYDLLMPEGLMAPPTGANP